MTLKPATKFAQTEVEMINETRLANVFRRRVIRGTRGTLLLFLCLALHLPAQHGVLSLEEATRLALDHNRSIQQADLEAKSAGYGIEAARAQRRPSFRFASTTGVLLTRPTVTFERGVFGEYPGIGPLPGNTTNIESPRKATMLVTGEALMPLTPQIRIGLGIRSLELGQKIAQQQVRLTRQEVVKQVRLTYYSILQSQSSLDAVEHTLALLRELSKQTAHYVRVGTALDGDLLSVRARLAQAEYDKVALTGPLATSKEQLNLLLGRPIDSEFRVSAAVEASWIPEVAEARERAVTSRPEVEHARLKMQQAELDRRKKKSEYIPDVALTVSYTSAVNLTSTMPRNMAIAGVQTSWEPFDWGRKRNELAQKQHALQEAALVVKEVEDKIRIEVGSAHRKMQEARVLLAASRANQESAREAARVASVRFRSDAALLKNVLEAQSDVANADDRTRKALLSYWSARAELEMAMGEER